MIFQNLTAITIHDSQRYHVSGCYKPSKCIKMYQNVSKCIKMYQNVSKCIKMYHRSNNKDWMVKIMPLRIYGWSSIDDLPTLIRRVLTARPLSQMVFMTKKLVMFTVELLMYQRKVTGCWCSVLSWLVCAPKESVHGLGPHFLSLANRL